MGLDMSIIKEHHGSLIGSIKLNKKSYDFPLRLDRVVSVREQLAKWHNAGGIHAWFCEKFGYDEMMKQNNGDFGEVEIDMNALVELRDVCHDIYINKGIVFVPIVEEWNPGDDWYNKLYYEDIEFTYNTISDIIVEIEEDEKNGYYATYYYTWS